MVTPDEDNLPCFNAVPNNFERTETALLGIVVSGSECSFFDFSEI
jgi:hypothetical protein